MSLSANWCDSHAICSELPPAGAIVFEGSDASGGIEFTRGVADQDAGSISGIVVPVAVEGLAFGALSRAVVGCGLQRDFSVA